MAVEVHETYEAEHAPVQPPPPRRGLRRLTGPGWLRALWLMPIAWGLATLLVIGCRAALGYEPLWELQPVEVRVRSAPPEPADPMPALEAAILQQELGTAGTAQLREWMRQRDLALISSRDVTVRADRQQDYNLAIAWSDHRTAEPASTPKQLGWLQVVEARQLRGFDLFPGRRILPRPIASALKVPVADTVAIDGASAR